MQAKTAPLGKAVRHQHDEVVCVSGGEGATSEGEFWEALNTASNRKLPVVFFVENNGYAISVPCEVQTPGGDVAHLVANHPNLHIEDYDGTDPLESYAACQRAVTHCRERPRPGIAACACDAALLAFSFGRRKALQIRRRTRNRSAPRSNSEVWIISGA